MKSYSPSIYSTPTSCCILSLPDIKTLKPWATNFNFARVLFFLLLFILFMSMPNVSLIYSMKYLTKAISISWPPSSQSPDVARTQYWLSSIFKIVTSSVPPPKSKMRSVLFSPSVLLCLACDRAAAVGSSKVATHSRPARSHASTVAALYSSLK